jgi:feruloyl-CoA synthase
MTLTELLDLNARKFGSKDALRFNGQGITFLTVKQQAENTAAVLQNLGVAPGDRVAVMSFNTPEFVYAFFGCMKAGAVVVPVNHKLMAPEVDYILAHSGTRCLFFDSALLPVIQELNFPGRKVALDSPCGQEAPLSRLLETAPAFRAVAVKEGDAAEILYTSGTTGKPKGCLHSHRNVIMAGITGALAVSMQTSDRLLMAMPIWHSSPLNNWFMGAQYLGATTVLLREYHPLSFLQAVQNERCTVYFGAPISYLAPLQLVSAFDTFELSSMRCWIYGGGPIGAKQARLLAAKYKSDRFFQVYGMTEAGPTGTTLFPEEQVAKAGSIGKVALPGADLKVMASDHREAGPGEVGEIWLKAESMMDGYFNDAEASAAAFCEGWYKTGDVVRIDADGYLFIVDRSKDMIVTGGENVYSKEVEDVLTGHPQILEAAVIGQAHPQWGETVVALYVVKQGVQETPGADSLKAFLADKLAKYKIPKTFIAVKELPRTPTGKVMKYVLRRQYGQ